MKHDKILLGHGSGGRLTQELIRDLFIKQFNNPVLSAQTDSALLSVDTNDLAFTTDSYVVDPVFFPGGNIGKMAVCGTVNDLAVSGATPLFISAAFIIEEGFPLSDLEKIVRSMAEEAAYAGVKIVTGDTKVVNRGKCDKLFINTSGIGKLHKKNIKISTGTEIQSGDRVIINGYIGDHGITIMCARDYERFKTNVVSDCASLNHLISKILNASIPVKFMRDATRGGLASVLCEITEKKDFGILLQEEKIPLREPVKGMCELFGFDPLYVANEGKVVIIAGPKEADNIMNILKNDPSGEHASVIGEVVSAHPGNVLINTEIGGTRIIQMISGEQLPRIC